MSVQTERRAEIVSDRQAETKPPEPGFMLEAEAISKQFPGVQALKNVSLAVRRGEIHALVGENGAGKSTLVNIIAGVVRPDSGTIRIKGRETRITSPKSAAEAGIAVVHQESSLYPNLDVTSNLFLMQLDEKGRVVVPDRRLRTEARGVLDQVGLAHISPTKRVSRLTPAERQLLEIGRGLVKNVELLVLDEPTSALAEREIETLFDIVRGFKRRGIAVIFVSHRLEEVFALCDRVTVLRDGEHIRTVETAAISRSELVHMILGRRESEMYQASAVQGDGEEVLRVERLRLRPKLREVSLVLHRGEILGIAGLLGAGRTELARAIFGLTPWDGGKLSVKGKPVRINSPDDAVRLGIGYITEDRRNEGLILERSIKDNIVLASLGSIATSVGWVVASREMTAARRQKERLNIVTPSLMRKVKYLSGGNQQKVILGKWLETNPEIFLLDEPTRGIDVGTKAEFYRIIRDLAAGGAGVLFISSELQELVAVCHRILVLRQGEFRAEFVGKEINAPDILMAMTGGN